MKNLTEIKISKELHLSTLLFADEKFITADTEGNLQKAAHKLIKLITECDQPIYVCTENKIDGTYKQNWHRLMF
jgi:hypothetical protein